MHETNIRKFLLSIIAVTVLFLCIPWLLNLLLPFLLGLGLAKISEPAVQFLARKLPRSVSSLVGVGLTLLLGVGLVTVVGAVLVRQLGRMAAAAPDIRETFLQGVQLLQDFLVSLSNRAPEGIRPTLTGVILEFFSSGTALLDRAVAQIPALVGAVLGKLPDRILGLGTGILAGFLISARFPGLKSAMKAAIPERWECISLLKKIRHALVSWLAAQGKLALCTFAVAALGLWMLRIPYAPAWAVLIAAVDAIPLLGTGTVLLPWAMVKFLKSQTAAALGLLGIYGAALGLRLILEPRLVGRHLGLDPLVTLVCLYLGYRFWGLWGMIFFPMIAGAVKSVTA